MPESKRSQYKYILKQIIPYRDKNWKVRAAKSTFAQRINVTEQIPVVFKMNGCPTEPEKVS